MQYLYVQDNAVNWIDPLGLVRQVLKIDGVNISDDEWKQVGSSIYVELNKLGRASQASAWCSRGDRGYLRFTTGMNSEEYEFVFGTDSANVYYKDWFTDGKALQIAFHKDSGNFFMNLQQFNNYHKTNTSYGMRYVGFGVQIELSTPILLGFGAELIWYTYHDEQFNEDGFHCYLFGEAALSGDDAESIIDTVVSVVEETADMPILIRSVGARINGIPQNTSVSFSVFAVYGNENFNDPKDYRGYTTIVSGIINHIKGFVAVSEATTTIGIGFAPFDKLSCSISESAYAMLGDGEILLTGITLTALKEYVARIANGLPAPNS